MSLLGNKDEAISLYTKILELDPQNIVVHCNRSMLHHSINNKDLLRKDYEQITSLLEDFTPVLNQYDVRYVKNTMYLLRNSLDDSDIKDITSFNFNAAIIDDSDHI